MYCKLTNNDVSLILQVFDTGRSMLWIFYTVGYGLPSVIVLLSVVIVETSGIHGYGSDERYILKLVWIMSLL